jgi:hypothetical protein
MSEQDGKDRETVPISGANGNALFERSVAAIGLDETAMRWLLVSVLNTVGSTPGHLTPEELGNVLPEVDRRLRKLVPDAQADAALKRLYHVLFDQAEPA